MNVQPEKDALLSAYETQVVRLSAVTRRLNYGVRAKPLLGGCFGAGGFSLTSVLMRSAGLDEVAYMVRHDESGLVLSTASERGASIAIARKYIGWLGPIRVAMLAEVVKAEFEQAQARDADERAAALADRPPIDGGRAQIRSIPKRRQAIFDASAGKCHYCGSVLTIDGRWHIEHKMPRALLGGSEQSNLVASCVTCNMRKKDSTDLEFKAKLSAESA